MKKSTFLVIIAFTGNDTDAVQLRSGEFVAENIKDANVQALRFFADKVPGHKYATPILAMDVALDIPLD